MALRDKELQAIRAQKIIAMRTDENMTNVEIAQKLNVHPDTVRRSLSWAKKAGLFVEYEDQILKDVVPLAIAALQSALNDGDGELAIKVLNNTLWAAQNAQKNQKSPPTSQSNDAGDHDLASYIAQIRQQAAEEDETQDAQITAPSVVAGLLTEAPNA
jgi:trehalose/maltose hydrolase-like predicted phosphorylase